jgi:hypothetical protein
LIEGDIKSNGVRLSTGDAAYITGPSMTRIRAEQPSAMLVDTPFERERM